MKGLYKIFCVFVLLFVSCNYGPEDIFGRKDPVSVRVVDKDTRAAVDPGVTAPFRFIVTADLHFGDGGGPNAARVAAFQNLINAENPAFAVFCGDLANSGRENQFADFRTFADSLTNPSSGGLPIPWLAAIGNHDIYNDGWQYFRSRVGPTYFHFNAGSVSLYVIDTANGSVGDVQLDMLKRDFAADPNPKIVFTHYPIRGHDNELYYRLTSTRERAILLDLFGRSKVKAVFVGHVHYPYATDCKAFYERISGSLIDSEVDRRGHCWIVDVDASGNVTAQQFTL